MRGERFLVRSIIRLGGICEESGIVGSQWDRGLRLGAQSIRAVVVGGQKAGLQDAQVV